MMEDKDIEEYNKNTWTLKWNKQFSYPKSQRELVMGQRHYAVDNQKLPSVTTIISQTQSKEKQDSLANWRAKVGDICRAPAGALQISGGLRSQYGIQIYTQVKQMWWVFIMDAKA